MMIIILITKQNNSNGNALYEYICFFSFLSLRLGNAIQFLFTLQLRRTKYNNKIIYYTNIISNYYK